MAGLGGLGFIFTSGTIGGRPMDLGFGLYGILSILAALQTYRLARVRRFACHRAWAIRLYALLIGSWLYRMEYGFWLLVFDGLGHIDVFNGPFDVVMAYFFYIPNLLIAEFFIRGRRAPDHSAVKATASLVLGLTTLLVIVGTYYFGPYYWGPAIGHAVIGRA